METNDKDRKYISRRTFLERLGMGTAAVSLASCGIKDKTADSNRAAALKETSAKDMTYRTTPTTGDKVSLLGFGMMRLPSKSGRSAREGEDEEIDQEAVNRLVDYALEHGVNYFDTSPAYCKGFSERATGIALKRHPRNKYFIATKLSNFAPDTWSREESMKMYRNSFKELQTEYIDYLLLHGIGMGGMESLNARYINNGILDFLVEERKAGRIRNLGFSYHGDVEVFDYLLSQHDKYKWDFVQIQMNYADWKNAKATNERNTDAEYLYGELKKRGIPAVIMEPLLGGRLAVIPDHLAAEMMQREPERSVASWAFRFCGTYDGVLTVLSGMNQMEHLKDNLLSFAPLKPLTDEELDFMQHITTEMLKFETIPCTACKYCMPCPYGLDIPAIFQHYNKCVNEGNVDDDARDEKYAKARRAFLVGYDRSVPKLRQANHCIGCNQCAPHCPQRIDIPRQMQRIDAYVERLKQGKA